MIALHNDCLLFQLASGESVPCSAEMISVEVIGDDHWIEPDLLRHAAASVFHYFKKELARETVTPSRLFAAWAKAVLAAVRPATRLFLPSAKFMFERVPVMQAT